MFNKRNIIAHSIEAIVVILFLYIFAWLQRYGIGTNEYHVTELHHHTFTFKILSLIPLLMGISIRIPSLIVRKMESGLLINWPRMIAAILISIIFLLLPSLFSPEILSTKFFGIIVFYFGKVSFAALWAGIAVIDSFERRRPE